MLKHLIQLIVLLALAVAAAQAEPIVFVSVLPQAYFVEKVAGGLVEIEVMIPPGATPTTHRPTMAQLKKLSQAALYIKVGHHNFPFEKAWLDKILSDNPQVKVLNGAANIEVDDGDPHLWLNPLFVKAMSEGIAKTLSLLLPEKKEQINANLQKFILEIDAFDKELLDIFKDSKDSSFIVFHPAWGYFARRYGLEEIAIEVDGKAPGARELGALITTARERGIRVVFVQPGFSKKSAQLIAEEINGVVEEVDPLARDWFNNLRRVAHSFKRAAK